MKNLLHGTLRMKYQNKPIWNCHKCNYHAYEDESHEKNCLICKNKTKSKLKDNKKDYWWCFTCKKLYYS